MYKNGKSECIKLSIITINYNNAVGLDLTIRSVLQQTYKNIEYIIIDGGSKDNSFELIKKNSDKIEYWVSEPDKGVYHAMNKGIMAATGDYLLFLNSGDYLNNAQVIADAILKFNLNEEIVFGDLYLKGESDELLLKEYPTELTFNFFFNSESLPHPATFIKRSLFQRVGLYTETFKVISDWEFWLKALFLYQATYRRISIPISVFILDGISSDIKNVKLIEREKNDVYFKYFPYLIKDFFELNKLKREYTKLRESIDSSRTIKGLRKLGLTKL